jgi:prophage regulatory protein
VQESLVPITEVCRNTGLSESTVRRLEKKGLFPKRRQITSRRVGFLKTEIEAWIQDRASTLVVSVDPSQPIKM